jgi:hypothetical protein
VILPQDANLSWMEFSERTTPMALDTWPSHSTTPAPASVATCMDKPMTSLTANMAIGTAAPAGRASDAAVHQTAISSALRQLRQLRQDYLFNCSRQIVRTVDEDKHVKGLLKDPANSAGPAVSQQHQGVTNGRPLPTACRTCRDFWAPIAAPPDPNCACATKCRPILTQVQRLRSTRVGTDQQIN